MKNAFDQREADDFIRAHAALHGSLALRIYTSRLLGRETSLVLHGGGNTSVKVKLPDLLGEEQDVLFVKGSGHDLATIDAHGFTGVRLSPMRRLRDLGGLDDIELENELLVHRLRAGAPAPSVETLAHAFLPHRFVDHTHADAVLILTNRVTRDEQITAVLGEHVAVLPYTIPGFPLASQIAACYEANPELEAIVSRGHGIFTFAHDNQTSYSRMIDYVTRAEAYIESETGRKVFTGCVPSGPARDIAHDAARVAQVLRGACSHVDDTGRARRFVVELRGTPELIELANSPEAQQIGGSGVLTPDHAIRTKNRMLYLDQVPATDGELVEVVKRRVSEYAAAYDAYFDEYAHTLPAATRRLDGYPRLALVAGVGLVALGATRRAARVAADIGEHTLHARHIADALGGYSPIDTRHVFDMEYWSLQQKKLSVNGPPPLEGQVALVTGAGGAIGAGIADRLLAAGANVVISDIDRDRMEVVRRLLEHKYGAERIEDVVCDVTDFAAVERVFRDISCRLGGIDLLVPNAGIAHVARIEDLDPKRFEVVLSVNLMGTFNVIKAAIPILRRQASGGNIVLISSKNVPDPGASFGAYSASKAGAHQIGKIAALELAELGVRVNMVNPDAVFGDETVSSGLWDLVGPDRMRSRGLDPDGLREYYRERNLLKVSVRAEHVGNIVVFFACELTPTTGASFPVDGGVPSAFPR